MRKGGPKKKTSVDDSTVISFFVVVECVVVADVVGNRQDRGALK
jgi:hypothetical protein